MSDGARLCRDIQAENPVNTASIEDIANGEFDENEVRKEFTVNERFAPAKKVLPKEKEKANERNKSTQIEDGSQEA